MDSFTSEGAGALKTRYVAGVLTFYRTNGTEMFSFNPKTGAVTYASAITASGGVVGAITGNIVGDVTGDVVGDLTGDVTGNTSGSAGTVTGAITTAIDAALINGQVVGDTLIRSLRVRHTVAELNSGQVLLPALPGFKYRLIDYKVISVGGAMGTATSLEIEGDQSGAVDLVSIAAAALTENATNTDPLANNTVLAAGATYVANDANTAISLSSTGTADTMTHVDILLTYTVEA